jgi:hypothetical protein
MPMKESPREAWARSVAESHLSAELEFADSHGSVDYVFTDPAGRSAAMEVTTLTDQQLKRSVDAYTKTRNCAGSMALLGSCWTVGVDERDARFKGLEARLEPHLALFENIGVAPGHWLTPREVRSEHPNADVEASVASLATAKVRTLIRWTPELCEEEALRRGPHSHEIHVSTAGEFVEVGTDVALNTVEAFVKGSPDNLRKLADSGAVVKHLFVCLDTESSASVSHSVSRRYALWSVDGQDWFGLPRRPPHLPAEVDELWVVYMVDGDGWHWGGSRWARVEQGGSFVDARMDDGSPGGL